MSLYISGAIDPRGVPGVSWVRASDAWFRQADDADGERWAAVGGNDLPRVHSWTGNGRKLGLLVEPARTNIMLRSDQVDTWASEGTPIVTANASTGPDGTVSADRIEDDSAAAGEGCYQSQNPGVGATATCSVWGRLITSAGGEIVNFNGATWGGNVDVTSTTWARYALTRVCAASDYRFLVLPAITAGASFPSGGSGATGTADFWGAQVEVGQWPSSYIPTGGAAATRAADQFRVSVASLDAHGFSASYGRARMVFVPSFAQDEETGVVWLLGLSAAAGLRYDGADDNLEIFSGGARVASSGALTFARGTHFVLDVIWNGTLCQLSVIQSGASLGAFTGTWTAPALGADIYVGSDSTGTNQAGGTYSHIDLGFA